VRTTATLLVLVLCSNAISEDAQKRDKPKFTIGKDTTYVTGPLDKDGFIDYAAALNEMLGKGAKPDNNANVHIWNAIGPRPDGKRMPEAYFKLMVMEEPPEKGDYFVDLIPFLKRKPEFDPNQQFKIEEQFKPTFQRPWTSVEFPDVAAWLKANEKSLATFIEASKRSRRYSPALNNVPGRENVASISSVSPVVHQLRAATRALTCRAMQRTGSERFDDAWQDLLAAHRLGRLTGAGGILLYRLPAISFVNAISQAELVFIERTSFNAKQLRQCLNDLRALPALPDLADDADFGDRLLVLHEIMSAIRDGVPHLEMMLFNINWDLDKLAERRKKKHIPKPEVQALLDDVDWDPILSGPFHK
jgi:hypothetical protein